VRLRFLLLAGATVGGLAALVAVLISPQVRAGPPPAVIARDAAAVRAAGDQVTLAARSVDGASLLEPRSGRATPVQPLAVGPDGLSIALSPVAPGQAGPVVLAASDGSQLDVALPGVRGAAFSPNGDWVAVVDLTGALWRVETATGSAIRLADGPFGPDPTVLPDDRVLVVRLSSVEAPTWASAQLIDQGGAATAVDATAAPESQLDYQAAALLDGSVAVVRHRTGGGVDVIRIADGQPTTTGTLDAAAVAVSPTGERLAWASNGTLWLDRPDAHVPFNLGSGRSARFSPDGSLLLLFGDGAASVVDLAGNRRGPATMTACWFGDGRGCRP
jgi:hypothetical protein